MRFPKSGPIVLLNYCSRRYRAWATKVPILFSCKTEALNPGPQTPPPPLPRPSYLGMNGSPTYLTIDQIPQLICSKYFLFLKYTCTVYGEYQSHRHFPGQRYSGLPIRKPENRFILWCIQRVVFKNPGDTCARYIFPLNFKRIATVESVHFTKITRSYL